MPALLLDRLADRHHRRLVDLSDRLEGVVALLWLRHGDLERFLAAAVHVVAAANETAVSLVDDYVNAALLFLTAEPFPPATVGYYSNPAVIAERLTTAATNGPNPASDVAAVARTEPRQAAHARLAHVIRSSGVRWVQAGGSCSICAPHNGAPITPDSLPRHRSCACTATPEETK